MPGNAVGLSSAVSSAPVADCIATPLAGFRILYTSRCAPARFGLIRWATCKTMHVFSRTIQLLLHVSPHRDRRTCHTDARCVCPAPLGLRPSSGLQAQPQSHALWYIYLAIRPFCRSFEGTLNSVLSRSLASYTLTAIHPESTAASVVASLSLLCHLNGKRIDVYGHR